MTNIVDQITGHRRMRRNRKAGWSRRLVAENVLTTADLIWPIFLMDTREDRTPVAHMPGVDRLNIAEAQRAAEQAAKLGIPAVAPFPYVDRALRDPRGTWIVQDRIPVRREIFPMFDAQGRVTMQDMLVDLAPYLFRGRMGGYLTRLSSGGLANVTSGGGQVPAFVLNVPSAPPAAR